ncbi:MAG TPA: hypothetical protein VKX17_18040 [Planctomycetota bacterium]|nr:hypothetical protein [Planctomycetota bacterium]
MTMPLDLLNRLRRRALIVGAIAAVVCGLSLLQGADRVLHSYLFAFCNWTGIALGCMAILLLQYLASGRWGVLLQRIFEAGALTLPLMLLLFFPIAFLSNRIYPWVNWSNSPEQALRQKAQYLNSTAFILRSAFYFGIWIGIALCLRRWSLAADSGANQASEKMYKLSGPGLLIYVLTATFAAIDWTMSLEPEWTSTIYGLLVIVGQGLSAMALAVLLVGWLARVPPFEEILTARDFNDFGNLLMVFVLLAAYASLSQFLIIWSGNLPEEAVWYIRRSRGGWQWVVAILAAGQFLIPFLALLSRRIKGAPHSLMPVAILLIVVHVIEWYWLVMPAFERSAIPNVSDVAAPIALGGFWLAAMVYFLKQAPLLSVRLELAPPEMVENSA